MDYANYVPNNCRLDKRLILNFSSSLCELHGRFHTIYLVSLYRHDMSNINAYLKLIVLYFDSIIVDWFIGGLVLWIFIGGCVDWDGDP